MGADVWVLQRETILVDFTLGRNERPLMFQSARHSEWVCFLLLLLLLLLLPCLATEIKIIGCV